jgi:DNA-binding IclR family transcriptional regulator
MATSKQSRAARRNVNKAQRSAAGRKTIAHLPAKTRTALGKQGAAVARRTRTGGASPKTRAELYEVARQRDLPGRSKMGRGELARKLGETSG